MLPLRYIIFLLIILFFTPSWTAAGSEARVAAPQGSLGGSEVLVASDVGRGGAIYRPKWCGSDALLFKGKNIGVELIELATGKQLPITSDPDAWPLNCSPDGRWLVYMKDAFRRASDYGCHEGEGETLRKVEVLHLYDLASGKDREFLVTEEFGSFFTDAVSPDGSRIYVGAWPCGVKEKFGPGWEPVRFTEYWDPVNEVFWFADSSGIVALNGYPFGIAVEVFGEKGWRRIFRLDPEKYGENFSDVKVDEENRVYFTTFNDLIPDRSEGSRLYRCSIEKEEFLCEEVLEYGEIGRYETLPGGDIVFKPVYGHCIRRATPGSGDAECVLERRYEKTHYKDVDLIGVSPDGRWLAYTRDKGGRTPSIIDLFIMEISDKE